MSQGHILHLISEFIDGELDPKMSEKVRTHLFFCNHCRNILKETQENEKRLKDLPFMTPSKGLDQKIIQALKEEMKSQKPMGTLEPSSFWGWFVSYKGLALAATAVLVVVLFKNIPQHLKSDGLSVSTVARHAPLDENGSASDDREVMMNEQEFHDLTQTKIAAETTLKEKLGTPAPIENLKPKEKSMPPMDMAPFAKVAPKADIQKAESKSVSPIPVEKKGEISSPMTAAPSIHQMTGKAGASAPAALRSAPNVSSHQPGWSEITGASSGFLEPMAEAITNARSWSRIWARHVAGMDPKPGVPTVNFTTHDVLFVCPGSQPTGGYAVEFTRVENTQWEGKPARVVYYRLITPPENSMKTMVITQPFIFRQVPKSKGPTFFKAVK